MKVRPNKFFSLTNQSSGELLDINFGSVYDSSKTAIMSKAALFGLLWLGDGATIKKMPLIHLLVMCDDKPPVVISIHGRRWEKRCRVHHEFFQKKK